MGSLLSDGTLLGEKEGSKDGSLDIVGWKLGGPVGFCDGVKITKTRMKRRKSEILYRA